MSFITEQNLQNDIFIDDTVTSDLVMPMSPQCAVLVCWAPRNLSLPFLPWLNLAPFLADLLLVLTNERCSRNRRHWEVRAQNASSLLILPSDSSSGLLLLWLRLSPESPPVWLLLSGALTLPLLFWWYHNLTRWDLLWFGWCPPKVHVFKDLIPRVVLLVSWFEPLGGELSEREVLMPSKVTVGL
jgi:hypothetical protein